VLGFFFHFCMLFSMISVSCILTYLDLLLIKRSFLRTIVLLPKDFLGTRTHDILLFLFKDDPSLSEHALDGLRQVMAVKSRVVLPFLVPQVSALPQGTHLLNTPLLLPE